MSNTQKDALEYFFEVWIGSGLLSDIGPKLTCVETDALADLLRAHDFDDQAETLIEFHAIEDDEDDSHFAANLGRVTS